MNNILSDITVHMKYAKYNPELNRRETWTELVDRNIAMHKKKYPNLIDQIDEAYKYVYDKKILPSMRSLQFAGKPIEISPNRLYNCSYLPADHTDCFRCRMLSFCDPKCVSWNQIVGTLNTTGVPTPSRARRGMSIRQYNLIPEDVPDDLIPAYRQAVAKIDTGVWDAIQVKRTLRIATKSIVTYL